MGSPIKINSISIDLANEIDMSKCDHFSIREFVNETRKRDVKKCWPFSKESISLADKESYSLPSLLTPKFRWWRCMSCVRDIDADGTKDHGLQSNSRAISEKKLDENPSVIPSKSKSHSLTAIDHERGKQTDIAGNDAVEENADKRSQKDDQTAAMSIKKVHPRSTDASTVIRRKSRKVASPEQVGNKRSSKEKVNKTSTDVRSRKEKQNGDQAVTTTFGSSEIAGVVEDTPPKANKNHKGSRVQIECDSFASEGVNLGKRKRTRKISDLLNEDNTKTTGGSGIRKEEHSSKRESSRGRKRKLLTGNNDVSNGEASGNADCEHSESNESDNDPIQGKKKNRRFQVVDDLPSETSPEVIRENHADAGKNTLPTPVNSLRKEKDSVPCTQTTQRTEKKLSIPRKKKNKTVTDNGKSTVISFSAGMDGGNQVKPPNGPFLNAISQSTRDYLNEKRAGSLLDERLASEGYFRKYNPQLKDKPPVSLHLQQDSGHLRSRAAETNLRDFGSSSKSIIGGWLRNGVDAVNFSSNNNNTTRSSFANFELRPSSTNVAGPSSVLQKDACVADRKGKRVMVQEDYEAPGSQSQYRNDNTPDDQNDDIPMEIVELMAKNQYERCLPDKEEDISNKQTSQETAHKSKNALLIDLNETYDNGISLEDNASRPPKPCDINARKDDHFPFGKQQKSLDFFPISQPYVPSPYVPPTQVNRAGSFRFSGQQTQNCHWIGSGPTMASQNPPPPALRMLRPCITCQSVPNQYAEGSYPYWSSSTPMRVHHKPVSFGMNQPTNLGMLSQPSSSGNTWNLNFDAANRNQTFAPNSDLSFGCKHAAGVNRSRPVDTFSNESSAMRLLSLMDPRVTSNTAADHHEKTKSTRSPFWPVNKSGIQTGNSSKTAYPTNQPPFDFNRSRFAPETSRRNFPIIPPVGTPSLSFQNAQASWNHHHHQDKKMKRKEAFAPVYNSHERPVFASDNNNNNQGKFQLLGASNSMMLPLKYHLTDKEKKQKRKAESISNASVLPPRNASGQIKCSVNRNPADFTIAEPGNVYMLTGEQLKVRKRTTLRKKDVSKQTKKPVGPLP